MTVVTTYFTSVICCSCGVPFAMSDELHAARRRDHKQFWCPNGHVQSYTGKSDAEKLAEAEKRVVAANREAMRAKERQQQAERAAAEAAARLEAEAAKRREIARKGNETKRRQREATSTSLTDLASGGEGGVEPVEEGGRTPGLVDPLHDRADGVTGQELAGVDG